LHDTLIVLTGAPGSGKTSVLDRLGPSRVRVREPARVVLAEQRAVDGAGTPERDADLFQELLLRRAIDDHRAALAQRGTVVFDRGVPDCIAYAMVLGLDPGPSVDAAAIHRYHPRVLVFPPWEAIYETDDERTMSYADTLPFHDAIIDAYARSGYEAVLVPKVPLEERVPFVDGWIADEPGGPYPSRI
jgi:predicted ATPase